MALEMRHLSVSSTPIGQISGLLSSAEERTVLAECGESATGPGCPEYGRREIFSLGQHAVEYNLRWRLHRREQNQATEEGRQADPFSRSKSAQKRQHKRIEGDYFAYCLMHASLKQSPRGASSGSPDNALHSLVIIIPLC